MKNEFKRLLLEEAKRDPVLNDSPVGCQIRGVTEPQREKAPPIGGGEVLRKGATSFTASGLPSLRREAFYGAIKLRLMRCKMNQTHNPKLTNLSKELRKSMTKEERHLWYDFLKELPITVNRQKVIGNYIVDFYIASSKIAIELDGSQHYESAGEVRDFKRDLWLHDNGIKVLRYSNAEVKQNFEGVCRDILLHITTSSTASGPPSPQGEGR